jgi:hypothetical protein
MRAGGVFDTRFSRGMVHRTNVGRNRVAWAVAVP